MSAEGGECATCKQRAFVEPVFTDWETCCTDVEGEQLRMTIMTGEGEKTFSSPAVASEEYPYSMKHEKLGYDGTPNDGNDNEPWSRSVDRIWPQSHGIAIVKCPTSRISRRWTI